MVGTDRISQLPADILDHILGLLPIQDTAKTAVLSTIWRDIWFSLTQLCFDEQFFGLFDKKYSHVRKYVRKSSSLYVITKVLLQHKGTILKFVIRFCDAGVMTIRSRSFDFDQWLLLVTRKGVEEMYLSFGYRVYKLPDCIFLCSTLKSLDLRGFRIEPLKSPCMLRNVTSLCFEAVEFCPRNRSEYVVNLPLLKNMSFSDCNNMFQFNITAANLSILTIKYPLGCEAGKLLPINWDLRSISTLDLAGSSLEYFVDEFARVGLPQQPLNVECLKLSNLSFKYGARISPFVRLLCIFPKLCKLDLTSWWEGARNCKGATSNGLEELYSLARTHKLLTTLKLSSFQRLRSEMLFIKEVVASLPAFEKLVIIGCPYTTDRNKEREIMQEILHFLRAKSKEGNSLRRV